MCLQSEGLGIGGYTTDIPHAQFSLADDDGILSDISGDFPRNADPEQMPRRITPR